MYMILASNSPRRKEILTMLGFDIVVIPSMCDENITESDPAKYSMELSLRKAMEVSKRYPGELVLGADTVVVIDGIILGKPKDREDAVRMLTALSGRAHEVYTGVSLCIGNRCKSFFDKTIVSMYDNSPERISAYIDTGDPFDKAGAYGIQGPGAILVKAIEGDFFNVMGLPGAMVVREIEDFLNEQG